jgi:phosphoribosylformylglycinamidine (FGAM) synthase PurS component
MIIEVWTKEKYAGNEELELVSRLSRAGLKTSAAKLSRLYKVEAPWPEKDFKDLASALLTDGISERHSLSARPGLKKLYRVEVWLKKSATDVIGESVKEAIGDMLGRSPSAVRFGRAYYIACASKAALADAVKRTLVNTTVNIFGIKKI